MCQKFHLTIWINSILTTHHQSWRMRHTNSSGILTTKRITKPRPNYSIVKIGLDTEKSPGDLRRFSITQTSVGNHHLTFPWTTLKRVIIIIIIMMMMIVIGALVTVTYHWYKDWRTWKRGREYWEESWRFKDSVCKQNY